MGVYPGLAQHLRAPAKMKMKTSMYKFSLKRLKVQLVRHVVTAGILALLFAVALPTTLEELKQRNAFHDPDTVQLMEWIKKETPTTAAFTGSMQLMAGVKLCTGRPITNHPHYEDRDLRIRTKQIVEGEIRGPKDHPAVHPRFCHAVQSAAPQYRIYFTVVFQNKTFRTYKVS
ncbi:hypothetical protein Bbelb_118910 [Branchiostoma belcheri]|nr:hypothetical protein Bbelb_118910 [Branchiostoma belcheri]